MPNISDIWVIEGSSAFKARSRYGEDLDSNIAGVSLRLIGQVMTSGLETEIKSDYDRRRFRLSWDSGCLSQRQDQCRASDFLRSREMQFSSPPPPKPNQPMATVLCRQVRFKPHLVHKMPSSLLFATLARTLAKSVILSTFLSYL